VKRNENVSVQLDVGDVLDVAIGRQDTFLILAPEQRDLHLLALVFVGVVLDTPEPSRIPLSSNAVPAVEAAKCGARVVSVWSRYSARVAGARSEPERNGWASGRGKSITRSRLGERSLEGGASD
jgi:hypothetical protein